MALYLSEMAALGVVGFDPLGAIIMLTFIAGGARFGHTLTFTAVNWIMIVVLGVAAGSALDAVHGPLRHWLESVPRWAWVTVETASAVGLLVWAIVRVRTGLGPDKQGGARSAPLWMLVAIAVGLAVAAFADPGYSGAVLAGSGHPASWRVVGLTLWYLIAMSPLVLVCIADGLGATARVSAWLHRWLSRSRRPVWIITTALIVVVAVLLAIDALLLAATGKFLP